MLSDLIEDKELGYKSLRNVLSTIPITDLEVMEEEDFVELFNDKYEKYKFKKFYRSYLIKRRRELEIERKTNEYFHDNVILPSRIEK
jgi:hypothetical protein